MLSERHLRWIDEWLLEQQAMQQGYQIVVKNGKRYKQTVVEEELATKQEFILVLDRSSSMHIIRQEALAALNQEIEAIKAGAKKTGIPTYVSVYTFADYTTFLWRKRAEETTPLTLDEYRPAGMTALRGAIGYSIDNAVDKHDLATSFALHIITDGGENQSTTITHEQLVKKIADMHKTDRWTIFAHGPAGSRAYMLILGIPTGNIAEWEQTVAGVQKMSGATGQSISNYYDARAIGATRSTTMLVTPDLSGVKVEDKLTPVFGYKLLEVTKETKIKEFVESNVGKAYRPGAAFYQLMKKERVEPNKGVLVMNKTNKRVFGGAEARQLIGLAPTGRCRVEPGNHANYDIFIQSLSTNRILPRGTKLLVEPY